MRLGVHEFIRAFGGQYSLKAQINLRTPKAFPKKDSQNSTPKEYLV